METNSVTDFDKIMKLIAVLMEQQEWSKANAYCEKLLESDPENPELYLIRCMISHQISNEGDLQKCAQDFTLDGNFRTALKFASPERRKELERIQENQGELSLRKCMDAARVSTEEELSFCRNPLNKNRDFVLAKRRVSPERRERLLRIQEMQADMYFLRERAKWGRRLEIIYFTANTLVISSLVFLFCVGWMIYDFVVRHL